MTDASARHDGAIEMAKFAYEVAREALTERERVMKEVKE